MNEGMSDIAVLRLAGPSLAHAESDLLKETLNQHLRAGQVRLILDFSDVEFVDSTVIGVLVASVQRINSFGGKVVICHVHPPIARILTILKLGKIFQICDTLDDARKTLASPPPV